MNYLDIAFYIFCPIFLLLYYIIPSKYRYLLILFGSYFFYSYGHFEYTIFLFITTLITYWGGIIIGKSSSKRYLQLFFLLNILILLIFKYSNFAITNISLLLRGKEDISVSSKSLNLILPIGLSFYIFQSCTYLTDIYYKKIIPEKNFLLYASFVSYFPTILSGPIQKSRELLPQIKNPEPWNDENAQKGFLLFLWGLFEKIFIANNLINIVTQIYGNWEYTPIYYILATFSCALYIYADFSSYSDIARGISKMMGINILKNFNNPFISLTTSEFWNRWHVSLNNWFIENIYIPLGGSREGSFKRVRNTLIVFLISGLWHGADWHYIIWGLINGIIVILGIHLSPFIHKFYTALKINETSESIIVIKRIKVFLIFSFTCIFFYNNLHDSSKIIKKIFQLRLYNLFDENLLSVTGSLTSSFVLLIALFIFALIQSKRTDERSLYQLFKRQPAFVQIILTSFFIVCLIFAFCMNDTQTNTQFLYFNF